MVDVKFRKSPEKLLNFSFQDLVQGQSYGTFYLNNAYNSAGSLVYFISPTNSGSASIGLSVTTIEDVYTKAGDYDFDILVNTALTVQGKLYLNASSSLTATSSGDPHGYLVIRLRKWDGTTETEIGSIQTADRTHSTDNTTLYYRESGIIDISSKVSFKIGEYIRITVEMWEKNSSGNSGTFTVYTDGEGRKTFTENATGATIDSKFIIYIPFLDNT